MALVNSPNVIRDGLVFSYDAANVRSFRGEPTTNAISSAAAMTGWTNYYRTVASSTFTTEFGTTGYRFNRQPSWNGIYRNFNLGSSGTYTFSAWFRYTGGSSNNNGATVYVSNYGGGDTVVGVDKGIQGVWQRVSHTVSVTSPSNVYFYLISYGGTDNGTGVPDWSTWEVTMPQIELKSYVTPFVDGTRGTTNATGGGWVDLSGNGNHGELVNGPIYDSANGGSIVFDGSNDYINLSSNIQSGYVAASYEFFIETGALPSSTYYQLYIQENSTWMALYNYGGVTFFGIDLNNGSGWFDNNGGYNTGARTTTTLQANTKYHIVYAWNGSQVKVYLNGNLESTTSTLQAANGRQNVTSLGAGTTPRMIGSRGAGTNVWNGKMYQVRFYSKELSANEVLQNFNSMRDKFGV